MEEQVFEHKHKRECTSYAKAWNAIDQNFHYTVRRKWHIRGFKGYRVVRFPISLRGIQIYLDRKAQDKANRDALKLTHKG